MYTFRGTADWLRRHSAHSSILILVLSVVIVHFFIITSSSSWLQPFSTGQSAGHKQSNVIILAPEVKYYSSRAWTGTRMGKGPHTRTSRPTFLSCRNGGNELLQCSFVYLVWFSFLVVLSVQHCFEDEEVISNVQMVLRSKVLIFGKVLRVYPDRRYDYGKGTQVYTAEMEVFCVLKGPQTDRIVNITEAGEWHHMRIAFMQSLLCACICGVLYPFHQQLWEVLYKGIHVDSLPT